MPKIRYQTVSSPLGPLTLAGTGSALMHLRMTGQAHQPDNADWEPDDDAFSDVAEQLEAYFAGSLTEFDVETQLIGTEFQRRVWSALTRIPYGETRSYGQIAAQIGAPASARAVGLANGRNPIAIIVPCHRVIGSGGAMTGYAGGIDRKRSLLDLERARSPVYRA